MFGSAVLTTNLASAYNDRDNPGCTWDQGDGELDLDYRFGSTVANPSNWRTAWIAGTEVWEDSGAETSIDWTEDAYAPNTFNQYNMADLKEGFSSRWCTGDDMSSSDNWGNVYYDTQHSHTADERKAIAAHEVGHASALGHSYTEDSLMEYGVFGHNLPTSTQEDDEDGIDDLYE